MSEQLAGITARNVEANGFRIHLLEAGEGPLVLLCHGFPELAYAWRHQILALAEAGYHAVAIDMLGYGRSSKPPAVDMRITTQVETFIEVVKAVGHETAVIVGHDMGAPRAWSAAWTRPDVFTAVAGVSVPFGARGSMAWPGDSFGAMPPSEIEADHRRPRQHPLPEVLRPTGSLGRGGRGRPARLAERPLLRDLGRGTAAEIRRHPRCRRRRPPSCAKRRSC